MSPQHWPEEKETTRLRIKSDVQNHKQNRQSTDVIGGRKISDETFWSFWTANFVCSVETNDLKFIVYMYKQRSRLLIKIIVQTFGYAHYVDGLSTVFVKQETRTESENNVHSCSRDYWRVGTTLLSKLKEFRPNTIGSYTKTFTFLKIRKLRRKPSRINLIFLFFFCYTRL